MKIFKIIKKIQIIESYSNVNISKSIKINNDLHIIFILKQNE